MVNVLFVCLGNICRSPMAEALFQEKVRIAQLQEQVNVDSAGTGNWHVGSPPHEGTLAILKKQQIDGSHLKARQVVAADLQTFDYVIGMDTENVGQLRALAGAGVHAEIHRLLDFLPEQDVVDVPDPYFTGNFEEVYELVSEGCDRLLDYIREKENL